MFNLHGSCTVHELCCCRASLPLGTDCSKRGLSAGPWWNATMAGSNWVYLWPTACRVVKSMQSLEDRTKAKRDKNMIRQGLPSSCCITASHPCCITRRRKGESSGLCIASLPGGCSRAPSLSWKRYRERRERFLGGIWMPKFVYCEGRTKYQHIDDQALLQIREVQYSTIKCRLIESLPRFQWGARKNSLCVKAFQWIVCWLLVLDAQVGIIDVWKCAARTRERAWQRQIRCQRKREEQRRREGRATSKCLWRKERRIVMQGFSCVTWWWRPFPRYPRKKLGGSIKGQKGGKSKAGVSSYSTPVGSRIKVAFCSGVHATHRQSRWHASHVRGDLEGTPATFMMAVCYWYQCFTVWYVYKIPLEISGTKWEGTCPA